MLSYETKHAVAERKVRRGYFVSAMTRWEGFARGNNGFRRPSDKSSVIYEVEKGKNGGRNLGL